MSYFKMKTGGLWSPDPPDSDPSLEGCAGDCFERIEDIRKLLASISESVEDIERALSELESKTELDEDDLETLSNAWTYVSSADEDLEDVEL